MLRGLYRDNSDHAVTGTTNETDMASTSVVGSTIGTTGTLHFIAAGTASGTSGTKILKLYMGSTNLGQSTVSSTAGQWRLEGWIYNTSATAQRTSIIAIEASSGGGSQAFMTSNLYTSAAVDTSVSQTFKLTCTLGNSGDTCTQKIFDVFVVQIT